MNTQTPFETLTDESFLWNLSYAKLQRIMRVASRVKEQKYRLRRGKRYGTLNRGFTDEELSRFLAHVTFPKAKVCFELMALLGLRVGEVVTIKRTDIDFENRLLVLRTEKAGTLDALPLHDRVLAVLHAYLSQYGGAVRQHDEWLFFSGNVTTHRDHISPHWLRKEFRETLVRARLVTVYGHSIETDVRRRARPLLRLSSHSLRHYFLTSVYRTSKDLVVTQRLARHANPNTTLTYINTTQDRLREVIEQTFDPL